MLETFSFLPFTKLSDGGYGTCAEQKEGGNNQAPCGQNELIFHPELLVFGFDLMTTMPVSDADLTELANMAVPLVDPQPTCCPPRRSVSRRYRQLSRMPCDRSADHKPVGEHGSWPSARSPLG